MFIQVTRKLPDNHETTKCLVNVDHIEWVQPDGDGGATLYMEAGPEVVVEETYARVRDALGGWMMV